MTFFSIVGRPATAQVGGEALPALPGPALDWAGELPAVEEGWSILVDAEVLAGHLGLLMSEDGGVLTLRGRQGILTLFEGSSDFLWQSQAGSGSHEETLSAAVQRRDGAWWLPVDVLSYLGLWLRNGVAEGADNFALRLVFPPPPPVSGLGGELVDLGAGVPGLRMFAAGAAGLASQSLLLADAGLLGLALPDQRQRFDELVARSGSDKPLLVLLTSATVGPWDSKLEFSQGPLSVEVLYPFRLRLLAGEATVVGPRSPVIGVVLLPAEFNLRQPINVRWGEASATVTFRQ